VRVLLTKWTQNPEFERLYSFITYGGIIFILLVWAIISTAQYLFDTHGAFDAPTPYLNFFEAEYILSAVMSLIIASVITYPVYKIWTTLSDTPTL
jgi:hypothetical protein